jgi:hypothetical protein
MNDGKRLDKEVAERFVQSSGSVWLDGGLKGRDSFFEETEELGNYAVLWDEAREKLAR